MSDRQLEDWVDGFVRYTSKTEAPRSYRKWIAISMVAAALQRKCYVEWGTITWYPNMYIILVGPSGVRKGTGMDPGHDLLHDIGIKTSAESTTRQALIRRLKSSSYTEVNQGTGEISGHCSMTVFSQEFTVFLGYQNKELMADLCDWYDCRKKWTYETKHFGIDEIVGVWVNIIGATTPRLIQSSMPPDAIGGGLTSRIVFVSEMHKGKTVSLPFLTKEDIELYELLKFDLEKINLMAGRYKFTEDFLKKWDTWYTKTDSSPPPFKDDRLAGYVSRRPTHIMKLAMILSSSRSGEMVLKVGDLERAIETLVEVEPNMPQVFSGVGKSGIADIIPRVMTYIAETREREVSMPELMQNFYYDADEWTMQRVLKTLESMNYITMVYKEKGPDFVRYTGPLSMVKIYPKEIQE